MQIQQDFGYIFPEQKDALYTAFDDLMTKVLHHAKSSPNTYLLTLSREPRGKNAGL
jgi:hypothetical protein